MAVAVVIAMIISFVCALVSSMPASAATINSFRVTPTTVGVPGGTITVQAFTETYPSGSGTCTLSSVPTIPGLPESQGCNDDFDFPSVTIPASNGAKKIKYKLYVEATDSEGSAKAGPVTVIQEATGDPVCSVYEADADLEHCNLGGANLAGTDLAGANLSDADLRGADLVDTDLDGANLSGSKLTGVASGSITGTPENIPPGWEFIQGALFGPGARLAGSGLLVSDANLSDLDLKGCSVEGANWMNVNLMNTDLENCEFYLANLNDVDLAGANLKGADLEGILAQGVSGTPVHLPSGWLLINGNLVGTEARLSDPNLAGGDLQGLNLSGLSTDGANLTQSNLSNVDFTDASISDSDFTSADLSGALFDAGYLFDDNFTGANLTGSVWENGPEMQNPTWSNTTCPDGTNSNNEGGTCVNNGA